MADDEFSEPVEEIPAERSLSEREALEEWAKMEEFAEANGLFLCCVRAEDEQGRLIRLGPFSIIRAD